MLPSNLTLEVVTPERLLAEETVQDVQLPAVNGYLGILPGHAPLLTTLGMGELSYRQGNHVRYLTVFHGYAEVLPDRVIVLADIGERAEEIDLSRAKSARNRAEQRLSKPGDTDIDWSRAALALERAVVRMQVAAKGGAAVDHE